MGRPRIPTALKLAKGTFREDRAPRNEPNPRKLESVPNPPGHLNKWAKMMWRIVAKYLLEHGILTALDLYSLEILCEQYGIYRELKDAMTHIEQPGGERIKVSVAQYMKGRNSQTMPEYACMRGAFERFTALLREFGLSPASRNCLDVTDKLYKTRNLVKDVLEID
jgi:P27 family predicted phage terminase small subunit